MKRYLLSAVSLLVLVTIVLTVFSAHAQGANIVAVQLTTRDIDTGEPLPNSTVYLNNNLLGKTDPNGNLLVVTSAGEKDIEIVKGGYERENQEVFWATDGAHEVSMTPTEDVSIDFLGVCGIMILFAAVSVIAIVLFMRKKDDKKKNLMGITTFALLAVILFMASTIMTPPAYAENEDTRGVTDNIITKGVNDVGFIASIPYTLDISETVTRTGLGIEEADRRVSVGIDFDTPEKEDERGLFDSSTVKWWDYDSRVGATTGEYIVGNSIAIKQPTSFIDYKTAYLRESTEVLSSVSFTGRAGEEFYSFDFPQFSLQPLLDWPTSIAVGDTAVQVAIDPDLLSLDGFESDFADKFGISFDNVQTATQSSGQTFISTLSPGNGILSGFLGNGITSLAEDKFKSELEDAKRGAQEALDKLESKLKIPIYFNVVIEVTVSFLGSVVTVPISIPIILLLHSMKDRYDDLKTSNSVKKVYKGSDCLVVGKVSGKVPIFIPFQRFISHSSVIDINVRAEGCFYRDRYDSGKVAVPDLVVGGHDFPILNNVIEATVTGIYNFVQPDDDELRVVYAPYYEFRANDDTNYETKTFRVA